MKKVRLLVPNVMCDGCKSTLEKAIGALTGVQAVMIDLANKYAEVAYDEIDIPLHKIEYAVREAGYEISGTEEMEPGTWK